MITTSPESYPNLASISAFHNDNVHKATRPLLAQSSHRNAHHATTQFREREAQEWQRTWATDLLEFNPVSSTTPGQLCLCSFCSSPPSVAVVSAQVGTSVVLRTS